MNLFIGLVSVVILQAFFAVYEVRADVNRKAFSLRLISLKNGKSVSTAATAAAVVVGPNAVIVPASLVSPASLEKYKLRLSVHSIDYPAKEGFSELLKVDLECTTNQLFEKLDKNKDIDWKNIHPYAVFPYPFYIALCKPKDIGVTIPPRSGDTYDSIGLPDLTNGEVHIYREFFFEYSAHVIREYGILGAQWNLPEYVSKFDFLYNNNMYQGVDFHDFFPAYAQGKKEDGLIQNWGRSKGSFNTNHHLIGVYQYASKGAEKLIGVMMGYGTTRYFPVIALQSPSNLNYIFNWAKMNNIDVCGVFKSVNSGITAKCL